MECTISYKTYTIVLSDDEKTLLDESTTTQKLDGLDDVAYFSPSTIEGLEVTMVNTDSMTPNEYGVLQKILECFVWKNRSHH